MSNLADFLSQHTFAVMIVGGAAILAFAVVFGRSAAAPAQEPGRREWRNPVAEWFELCRRMREVVGTNGPLVFKVIREMNPYGGEVAVVWEFQGQTDPVVAMRFSSKQTGERLRLAEKWGGGDWRPLYVSRSEFAVFLGDLEKAINEYASPLSRA